MNKVVLEKIVNEELLDAALDGDFGVEIAERLQEMYDDIVSEGVYHADDDCDTIAEYIYDSIEDIVSNAAL